MNKLFTLIVSAFIFVSVSTVSAQNSCNCWPERDTSFHPVPFSYCTSECGSMVAPYYRCDDAGTALIVLPFHFCFWGKTQDSIFINENGNITLGKYGNHFTTFSPDTFPNPSSVVPPMIAPFWGDVDSKGGAGGTDVVLYKITPHYLIVQWDSVGYYDSHRDKLNSFEAIISDGTDPIIPQGNNVEFCYRNMSWTTGDASSGRLGFGGDPATVGANQGDGVKFVQIGLFDSPGVNYFGQFPPAPNYDQVGWLSNKSFLFNLCAGAISPLLSGVSPCDTFRVCEGDSIHIPFYFFSPVQGDSVWSNLSPPVPSGVYIYRNRPGNIDSLTVSVVGSASNLGYHVINVYGYDNSVPSDTTYSSFVIEVDSGASVHFTAVRDTICIGDTAVLSAIGGSSFIWSTGATTSSIKVSPATSQTYTVGVASGECSKDTTIHLVVFPNPAPLIRAIPDSVCTGDTVLLIGSGGSNFFWSNGKTTDSIKVVPTVAVHTYTLTASNGICSDTASISIKMVAKTTATIAAVNDTVCPNGETTLTATGSGGQVTYKWSNGSTMSSINVTNTVTKTYTVTVYGVCDSVKDTMRVLVIPIPKPVISGTDWKCKGVRDTLTVTDVATSPTTYVWDNGKTTTNYITGPIKADSVITVTAYNSLGCSHDTSFTITLRNPPTVIANPPATFCAGQPIVLTATGSGTPPPSDYTWSTGQTGSSITIDPGPDSVTSYVVTGSNGCKTRATTTVTPDYPVINGCCNQTLTIINDTLTPSSAVLYAHGNSIKYQWIDSNKVICLNPPLCDSVRVAPQSTTTYTVIGTDANGCTKEELLTITVDIPCFNLVIPNVVTPTNPGPLGLNKEFYIDTRNIDGWSIVIFDRWGKQMYNSTNQYQYWTGTTEGGGEAPSGVYYYIIHGTCQGTSYSKDGFVQLIR